MKKLALVILLTLGWTMAGMAQQSSTDEGFVAVNAYVIRTVNVDVVKGVELGNVTPGTVKTVDVDDAEAGRVDVSSTNRNTPFIITVTVPSVLLSDETPADGVAELPVAFTFGGVNTTGGTSGIFTVTANDGTEFWTGPSSVFGQVLRTLYIGASVTPAEDQQGGAYSGQVVISVATN